MRRNTRMHTPSRSPSFGRKPTVFLAFIFLFCILVSLSAYLAWRHSSRAMPSTPLPLPAPAPPLVIIDPGHGGEDGGAVGINGCVEKELNLSIAKKLRMALNDAKIPCMLTRQTDTLLYDRSIDYHGRKKSLDMLARIALVRQHPECIFISIHQNSGAKEKYSGAQVYFSPNSPTSARLAACIDSAIKSELQSDNRRSPKASSGDIYLLDKLECTAVLLECGFISNAAECALLCDEEYQSRLCRVVLNAIEQFIMSQRPPSSLCSPEPHLSVLGFDILRAKRRRTA